MTAHSHTFLPVSHNSHRHRCSSCQVYGYRRGSRIVPMTCSLDVDGKRCGQEAVECDGEKTHNRCREHAVRRAA